MLPKSEPNRQPKSTILLRVTSAPVTSGTTARPLQSRGNMAGKKTTRRGAVTSEVQHVTFAELRDLPIGSEARPPLRALAAERQWGQRQRVAYGTPEAMRAAAVEARRVGSHGIADLLERELVRWSAESSIDST